MIHKWTVDFQNEHTQRAHLNTNKGTLIADYNSGFSGQSVKIIFKGSIGSPITAEYELEDDGDAFFLREPQPKEASILLQHKDEVLDSNLGIPLKNGLKAMFKKMKKSYR